MRDHLLASDEALIDMINRLAARAALNWAVLVKQCTEIVVFGSHAAGFQTPSSDLDLLLVTKEETSLGLLHHGCVDLLVRTEEQVHAAEWLRSELVGHIAAYGRWLHGTDAWGQEARARLGNDSSAADAKRCRIGRLTRSLRIHWDRLTPEFRLRNLITLRREEQRLRLLEAGDAVPPTRLLDLWAGWDSVTGVPQIHSIPCLVEADLALPGLPYPAARSATG